jgi:hypothetical protein
VIFFGYDPGSSAEIDDALRVSVYYKRTIRKESAVNRHGFGALDPFSGHVTCGSRQVVVARLHERVDKGRLYRAFHEE